MDPTSDRRGFLAAAVAVGLTGCARDDGANADEPTDTAGTTGTRTTATTAETTDTTARTTGATETEPDATPPEAVGLETLATGLQAPLDVAFAPDADRRYVADQPGRVYVHGPDGLRDEPFLDLGDAVVFGGERGLLGIALHPGFAANRRLFVRYSAPSRAGTPSEYSHTFVLAEFRATVDGRRVDPDSERSILEIPEPQGNHNAGSVAFGPDDLLHVGVGDGGAGGDQGPGHVDDWYDAVDGGNGQDVTENLLGSILRIDVDGGGEDGYAIPEDNPLVGREGLDEQYAWGLRNPWRFSFDGAEFLVGDVGQNRREEVDLVEAGENYGWNVREGSRCYDAPGCPDETPADVRGGEPLVDPIIEYPHSDAPVSGSSVIGGHVYRGSALPATTGTYIFGDLRARGRLFAATRPDDGGQWPTRVVDVTGDDADALDRILSFGRDADGEVYVLGTGTDGGGLHRIVPAE